MATKEAKSHLAFTRLHARHLLDLDVCLASQHIHGELNPLTDSLSRGLTPVRPPPRLSLLHFLPHTDSKLLDLCNPKGLSFLAPQLHALRVA